MIQINSKLREKLPYLLLIIMLFAFLFLSFNRLASLGELRESLQLQEKALDGEQERLIILRQLEKEGPCFQERLELFETLIPEEMADYQLIQHLQKITALSGVRLLQVSFGEEIPATGYMEMPLDLTLEGTFPSLLKLLGTMREGSRAFRIDNLQITSRQEGPALGITMTVSAFAGS